jgi:hypothetical protein
VVIKNSHGSEPIKKRGAGRDKNCPKKVDVQYILALVYGHCHGVCIYFEWQRLRQQHLQDTGQ